MDVQVLRLERRVRQSLNKMKRSAFLLFALLAMLLLINGCVQYENNGAEGANSTEAGKEGEKMHIDSYNFGSFVVNGKTYEHDIRIINNKISLWQNHKLRLDDVKDAVNANPKPLTIIIGTGESGVVDVSQEIKDFIADAKINLIIEKTPKACELYNELSKKENVAAVLHSTC